MKIKSFQEACKILKYNPKTVLPNVSKMPKHLQSHTIAKAKLEIISEAAREGVELDYNNSNQYKWYPWFALNAPGFRFDGTYCDVAGAGTGGSPRLCFLSREDAEFHGKKHLSLWKAAMVIPKKPVKKSTKKK